ncbi:SPOR domain-containing protein [Sphingomonas sp. 4RDLI-65]|uniref:SPOR domain-containing protein n=1 Tax=Sphingomonas sp. 4RDLI-65 TaxID=3111641 RepID=UPI003C27F811
MTRSSHHLLTAALALVLAAVPCAAVAQEVVQAIPGTTDADKLGDLMRRVASNPRDVDALIRAGDLSMGLGDLSGAAALFARAEKVNPRDGRIKAGMASILVRSERPGEALRYYGQAESLGLDPRNFAADRGLAYDLIGQQDRAQRDYRVALRTGPDDETLRRYALSLGISGKQELAIQQLNPLLLKSDRGAWRARAFILAMNGDVSGAEKIATTMMPRGTAQGLQPFFQRLPSLPASDRAFAVHFGEVHATPARLADARMAPPLGLLGADPTAPVMLAAVPQQPSVAASAVKKGRRDRRSKPDRVEMAAAARSSPVPAATSTTARTSTPVPATAPYAAPVQLAAAPMQMVQALPPRTVQAVPVPQPSYRAPDAVVQTASRTTSAAETNTVVAATVQPGVSPATPPVSVARVTPAPATTGALPATIASQMAAIPAGQARIDPTRAANALAASAAATPTVTASVAPLQQASVQPQPALQAAPAQAVQQASAVPLPTPGFSAGAAAPSTAPPTTLASTSSPTPVEVAAAMPPRAVAASEDSILARIVAGLSIPASELDVAPMHPAPVVTQAAVPVSGDAERVLAEAKAKTERDAAAKKIATEKLAADKLAADKLVADKKAAVDKKAAARKAIADKKALAEKKAAAAEKLAADKAAAEEKRIARANPARTWVQVSTGATEGDLPKAWKKAKAKAPTVFGTRAGWTAPWKATNRVLAGPFKTDAEARSFVNQLAKEGVSTFTFTSDPGEIITKLPPK